MMFLPLKLHYIHNEDKLIVERQKVSD